MKSLDAEKMEEKSDGVLQMPFLMRSAKEQMPRQIWTAICIKLFGRPHWHLTP